VVPSPAPAAAADVSLKSLKRSIKSKVAERAHATLQEAKADTAAVSWYKGKQSVIVYAACQ
jgi:hypothetical protein